MPGVTIGFHGRSLGIAGGLKKCNDDRKMNDRKIKTASLSSLHISVNHISVRFVFVVQSRLALPKHSQALIRAPALPSVLLD
jgi:hypothetical protein